MFVFESQGLFLKGFHVVGRLSAAAFRIARFPATVVESGVSVSQRSSEIEVGIPFKSRGF